MNLAVAVEGLDHPEGVCLDAAGTLYAGGEAGQLYRVDLDAGTVEQVATTGGFLLGICADGNGRIYACDLARHEVLRIDPATGVVDGYSTGTADRPMQTPNWAMFDDDGNLYVTDSGEWKQDDGRIYRIDPQGRTSLWSEASTRFPNGACLTESGDVLVVESLTPGLARIAVATGERTLVAELPGTVPDGVVLDAEGNAYVLCYRPDRIYKVSAGGEVEVLAEDPQGTLLAAPTNGVFVGDRLVVANLGRWHLTSVDLGVKGLPLRYPVLGR
jgi:gluconolactonase